MLRNADGQRIGEYRHQHSITKGKGKGVGKVHPRTGHEDPEVE